VDAGRFVEHLIQRPIHESRDQGRGRVRGLVHRDVSPHNVPLSGEREIKLADFGVS